MATMSDSQAGDSDTVPVFRLGRIVDYIFGEAEVEQFFESGGWKARE